MLKMHENELKESVTVSLFWKEL